jgi:general secretion pathway protein G
MTWSARGFTLIELLITVAIIAALASIVLPLAEVNRQREQEQELRRSLREIRDAIDTYKRAFDEGRILGRSGDSGYPPSLTSLVEGISDARSPTGRHVYFLRRVPRDPFHTAPDTPAHQTWGLRSYESPYDQPRPGKDVYDIYSLRAGRGLNGIPYREW